MSGKLLFVSDIEGCVKKSMAGVEQSRVLCEKAFFDALRAFLESHPANKIAFLGDYFDQGDGVVESIHQIMGLYRDYSTRIHIILGNRDLNKYRFVYEMNEEPQTMSPYSEGKRWLPVWDLPADKKVAGTTSGFYDSLATTTTLKARMAEILGKSMGAGVTKADDVVPRLHPSLTENQSCYLMLRMMSEPAAAAFAAASGEEYAAIDATHADFVRNARDLFTVGRVVAYDSDFKTLLSHAGGVSPSFFHDESYYADVLSGLTGVYYDDMELVRRALMNTPKTLLEAFHPDLLEIYNRPAAACATLFDAPRGSTPPPEYFLIQALGLKGDNGKPFASFVNSCDVAGCAGPLSLPSGAQGAAMTAFFGRLKDHVRVISHGHVPHCAPIPLVYRREEVPGLVFVDNDTSNGYRPKKTATAPGIDGVSDVPLAYVTKGGAQVGVGGVSAAGLVEGSPFSTGFESMIGEWTAEAAPRMTPPPAGATLPVLEKGAEKQVPITSLIKYADGKSLAFLGGYNSARLIPSLAGGRRRKTQRRKTQRRRKDSRRRQRTRA